MVDIPKTFERNAAVDAVENIIAAYQVHLSGVRGEDSRSVTRINDCRRTLQEINAGDALHQVQISLAVFAPDLDTLKRRVHEVINETRPWFCLRQEVGELLSRSVRFLLAHANQAHQHPGDHLAGHLARTGADAGSAGLPQAVHHRWRPARRSGRRRLPGLSQLLARQTRHP